MINSIISRVRVDLKPGDVGPRRAGGEARELDALAFTDSLRLVLLLVLLLMINPGRDADYNLEFLDHGASHFAHVHARVVLAYRLNLERPFPGVLLPDLEALVVRVLAYV